MADMNQVIDYLKSRSISTKKENISFIKMLGEVISTSTVISIMEMINEGTFEKFIENIQEWGYPIK